ncbi:MAG: hypothetical protein NUV53_01760 [Patescibacteria group bacterium]|nr:hypothetical protein [Patescibacteria group bacterium]
MSQESKNISTSSMRVCQNCKSDFVIAPEDAAFYARMGVPLPMWCFSCRVIRRMAFRNERTLYKRKCDVPGHSEQLISIFAPENPQRVYDHAAWWGDGWDALSYGRDMDFTRPFLLQVQELWREVPDVALLNINPVNSDYCSITEGNKNCYLVIGGDFNENSLYSTYVFNSKECMDTYWVSKSDYNYETVDCISCSRLLYSRYCEGCYHSAFLFNCRNCHDCFGCANLVNKSYQIWNVQYTKEEYIEKMKEISLRRIEDVEAIRKQFWTHALRYPRRFAYIIHSANSTGDNLDQAKNCRECFDVFGGAEDCSHTWLAYSNIKDLIDCDRAGLNAELGVDSSTIYPGSRVFYSRFTFDSHDIHYSYNSHSTSNLFGCVGMRNKQYCILNKQYSKQEYETLKIKIIEHMNAMPYVDSAGRNYKYGEFFPPELSPFGYNETVAQELAPLTRADAEGKGYRWSEDVARNYEITMPIERIPATIEDADDSILKEVIACAHGGTCNEQCTSAFRLIPQELAFYRAMKIPVPHLCPSCRHYRRLRQRNPLALWKRKCVCLSAEALQCPSGAFSEGGAEAGTGNGYKNTTTHFHGENPCPNEFETSYAPERPEIVYCENCYQSEIA